MSHLSFLVTSVVVSLTLSATPSLCQTALPMSKQLMETTVKNQIKSDNIRHSTGIDETQSSFSLTNAAATQDTASSYFFVGRYSDAACTTLVDGDVDPLSVCQSIYKVIYTYSSVDNSVSYKTYPDSKCTGAGTGSIKVATIGDTCTLITTWGLYRKYSVIPSISALNVAGFVKR
jgi:hypothetical protein